MSDAAPPPNLRHPAAWPRFVFGLIAPFALPFLIFLILGTNTEAWMHGTAWMLLIVLGLVAGFMHRSWAFLAGVVTAIGTYIGLGIMSELGWWPW